MPRHFRRGICSSHLTLCLNLNVIFENFSRAWSDLKITVYIFCCHLLLTCPWRDSWKIFAHKTYYIWYHWKENFILISICYKTIGWFLSVFGLLIFKEFVTWPWYKGWIYISHKAYCIWYHWKDSFMLINVYNRTHSWF